MPVPFASVDSGMLFEEAGDAAAEDDHARRVVRATRGKGAAADGGADGNRGGAGAWNRAPDAAGIAEGKVTSVQPISQTLEIGLCD